MLIAALLSLTLAAHAEIDPLAQAREGMAQCYSPNKAARTCRALATYAFHADGTITNYAEVLINPEPLIVMRAAGEVHVRDGAECGATDPNDIRAFYVDGVAVGADDFAIFREVIAEAWATLGEGEFCTTYLPNPDGTQKALVTIGGVRQPMADDVMLWVNPAEGWKVAP